MSNKSTSVMVRYNLFACTLLAWSMKDFEGTRGKTGGREHPIRLLIFGHVFTHSCKSCPAGVMMLSVALYKSNKRFLTWMKSGKKAFLVTADCRVRVCVDVRYVRGISPSSLVISDVIYTIGNPTCLHTCCHL